MILYQKISWYMLINPWHIARQIYQHRNLLWRFTRRQIEQRNKGSLLGMLWAVLAPLLTLSVYAFVFVVVLGGSFHGQPGENDWDYAVAIFLGLALIQVFLESLTLAPQSVSSTPNLVKKVVFPVEVIPLAAVGASLFHCLVSLGLVLGTVLFFKGGLSLHCLWLPVILAPLLLLSAGVAWAMAAAGVFLRDMSYITQFLGMVLTFMSGVFYAPSRIPEAYAFLKLNPLMIALDSARNAVLWHTPPQWGAMLFLYAVGLVVFVLGYLLFIKLKPVFANVL
jgi:lipopolysaccharide transport system permease protein